MFDNTLGFMGNKAEVGVIDEKTQKTINKWLHEDYDAETKKEILRLQKESPIDLLDAFYKTMNFGTGGLRGIMGVGTNRMNFHTVRAATQGLAHYILKQPAAQYSVFIGFDCRHHSHAFAKEAAKVLAANGIEVFLYTELRTVANVSFGVLFKRCIAGIMITASHNPPEYNGYKVYWSYGGQILPPHDQVILEEMNRVASLSMIKSVSLPHPLIHEVCEEIDQAYINAIRKWQLHYNANQTHGKELKIVYTNLHGSGITMIPPTLRDWGFTEVTLVEEQKMPDGDFPTVESPNPEEPKALSMGLEKLTTIKGDILLGTDPDTDRLGVVVMHKGKPFFFDGNQVACLLLEHVCRRCIMPSKPMCIKTIVTTELFRKIAEYHKVGCLDVLTGFKYVGETIHKWENDLSHHFILGAEESYGYLVGTHVRDKDAIISSACICEAALQMKLQEKTLVDLLYELYMIHGVYREKLLSLSFEGKEGRDKIYKMMAGLRTYPPKEIAGIPIMVIEDYLHRSSYDVESKRTEPLLLPQSDVLRFWLADKTKIVVRPSGTEPKIKLYCSAVEKNHPTDLCVLEKAIASCEHHLDTLIADFKRNLNLH